VEFYVRRFGNIYILWNVFLKIYLSVFLLLYSFFFFIPFFIALNGGCFSLGENSSLDSSSWNVGFPVTFEFCEFLNCSCYGWGGVGILKVG
jgi:hypothetical protein